MYDKLTIKYVTIFDAIGQFCMGCILFDIKLAQFSGSPVQNSFGSVETNCPEPESEYTRAMPLDRT